MLVHDGLQGAVVLQLLQSAVDGVQQLGVAFGNADGVIFLGVSGVKDLQAGVGRNELLGGGIVDDDGIDLAVVQGPAQRSDRRHRR